MEHIPTQRPEPGTKEHCNSTGGTITYTKTGLIHTAGQKYTGETPVQEQDEE